MSWGAAGGHQVPLRLLRFRNDKLDWRAFRYGTYETLRAKLASNPTSRTGDRR